MIGTTVSHYRILEKLGEGGMGVVFKAEDTKLNRIVALKFFPPQLAVTHQDRERFLREGKAAATLNHPNVATIFEINESGDQVFIALEYVEGHTLKSEIARHRSSGSKIPVPRVTRWGIQVADALRAAHDSGITHRDIKSENIMITKDDRAKILDFGLAKFMGGDRITQTGKAVGTLAFMSPEQILGEEVDHRTDLWSLGVVLYEMLTGEIPFRAEQEAATMYEILNVEPKGIDSYRADVPDHLRRVLTQLLQKDRSRRAPNATAIIEALTAQTAARPASAPERSIAVLYFENMSSEKENDYFCAGMTEDISTDLSRIKELKVVSRTDVLPFRDKEVNTRQVGEALRVSHILEGSVRKAGNRIRITAQLIDVNSGYRIWSERFDRLVEDIFDVQNEVSQQIVEALKISLTDTEKESLAKRPTDDLRAYDFYMRGRDYINKRGRRNIEAAMQMFEHAIAIDANFAAPHAGLAEAYTYMYEWYDGGSTWLGKAIEMNHKALSLDPTSLEAKFGIAMVLFNQRRLAEAKRALEQILADNSQFHPAHLMLGAIAEVGNDFEAALRYYRRAAELKPYDEEAWVHLDKIHRLMGDVRAAEDAALRVIEVTSRKLEASLDDVIVMSRLAHAYARFGGTAEAKATLKRVFEVDPTDGLALYNCSCAYALLGDAHETCRSLRRAIEGGFRAVATWAKSDAAFDTVRNDPEFVRLMSELAL